MFIIRQNENISDVKSVINIAATSTTITFPNSEKEVIKKSVTSTRSSSVFKVKFKNDDFLTKKAQGELYIIFF